MCFRLFLFSCLLQNVFQIAFLENMISDLKIRRYECEDILNGTQTE